MKDINNSNNNDYDIKFYENIIKSNIKNSIYLNQKDSVDPKSTGIDQDSNINFDIQENTKKNISEKELKPKEIEFSYNIFQTQINVIVDVVCQRICN